MGIYGNTEKAERRSLADFQRMVEALSDPIFPIVRLAKALDLEAQRIELDALASGAMPGEFRVRLMYRRHGLGSRLSAVLL